MSMVPTKDDQIRDLEEQVEALRTELSTTRRGRMTDKPKIDITEYAWPGEKVWIASREYLVVQIVETDDHDRIEIHLAATGEREAE